MDEPTQPTDDSIPDFRPDIAESVDAQADNSSAPDTTAAADRNP
jgi:hypothetical protein